jgi:glutathione S-transferase
MKLIGSLASPYTRIIRVLCAELNLPYEFEVTSPFGKLTSDQQDTIRNHNPLLRVPILIDGDLEIFESRIIATYLLTKSRQQAHLRINAPLTIHEENILSTIYGALDAGITQFMFQKSDSELNPDKGYFIQLKNRINSSLQWIDKAIAEKDGEFGKFLGFPEIVLMCCLEWFEKRAIVDWHPFVGITAVHAQFKESVSLVSTRIPVTI